MSQFKQHVLPFALSKEGLQVAKAFEAEGSFDIDLDKIFWQEGGPSFLGSMTLVTLEGWALFSKLD